MLDPNWISVEAAAEKNGCTAGYIRRLIREHKVESFQVNKRFYLVDNDTVERYFSQPRPPGRPRRSEPEKNSPKKRS